MKLFLVLTFSLGVQAQSIWFEPNRGQAHPSVQFLAHTRTGYAHFSRTHFKVRDVQMDLVGANPEGEASFEEPTGGISSYFIGQDETKWHTGVPHYGRVRMKDAYPGIDVVYYGNQGNLEYDFIVHPGADPGQIRLAFNRPPKLNGLGDLAVAGLRQHRARVHQGAREIRSEYVVRENRDVQLALARYDRSDTLTIDPVLDFSTYLGGPGNDDIADLKVDTAGFVYLAGASQTPQSPTLNPFQQTNTVTLAPFVMKVSGDGQHVMYYAVLSGNGWDAAYGVVVDTSGSPTIVGSTRSSNFPLKNAFQAQFTAAFDNNFIARLAADGRSLIYSTYFGGNWQDTPDGGAALDSAGNVWLAGFTSSVDFPLKNPIQATRNGNSDAFVAKFSPTGALLYSTYYGGSGLDTIHGMAVDAHDNVYLTGYSLADFPLVSAIETTRSPRTGFGATFLFAVSNDGQSVLFSTYLGNNASGGGEGVALDGEGNIYVAGEVDDPLLQTTPNALQPTSGGFGDVFLIELDPKASKILYSTYFGGSADDGASDVKVDVNGYTYLTGYTSSPDFPVKNPLQAYRGGGGLGRDLFVVKIAPSGSSLVYSTPWGGSGNEWVGRLALAPGGAAYVCGASASLDFPVPNAFQAHYGGGFDDGVFARISDPTPIVPSPLTASPGLLSFRYVQGSMAPLSQTVNVTGGGFVGSVSTAWLSVTTQSASVGVTVNPINLSPGIYTGSVALTPIAGTPASVAVTLTVFSPTPVVTSIDPTFVAAGASDTVITIHGSGFAPNTSVILGAQTWTVTPVQFVDNSTLKIDLPPSVLSLPVTWSIAVQNPQSQPSNAIALSVGVPAPSFTAASVVNAGSFAAGPVAPGEIVTIFGANLAGNVTFDNILATVVYSLPTQISATVPYAVTGPKTLLQVGSSVPVSLDVAPSAPGVFAAVANGDGTLTLYATGCGALTQDALPLSQLPVSATLNNEPVQVLYAGIAPGLVQGVNQINLAIPSDIGSGPLTIVLTAGAVSSRPFLYTLP